MFTRKSENSEYPRIDMNSNLVLVPFEIRKVDDTYYYMEQVYTKDEYMMMLYGRIEYLNMMIGV